MMELRINGGGEWMPCDVELRGLELLNEWIAVAHGPAALRDLIGELCEVTVTIVDGCSFSGTAVITATRDVDHRDYAAGKVVAYLAGTGPVWAS